MTESQCIPHWYLIHYTNPGSSIVLTYRTRHDPLNLAAAKDSLTSTGCNITDIEEVG